MMLENIANDGTFQPGEGRFGSRIDGWRWVEGQNIDHTVSLPIHQSEKGSKETCTFEDFSG